MTKKHIVALTGAGISQESGIKTFRDSDGLWENHNIMEVASPEGFKQNPELVLNFYNARRRQLKDVSPNSAHKFLAELEEEYKVSIITQNVDDLHERAGSSHVVHLHGELNKSRSINNENLIFEQNEDIQVGDLADDGHQLRPHIVWFGEAVPMISEAIEIIETAEILLIIGTSMQVYPAAGLINHFPNQFPVYFVNPDPEFRKPRENFVHIQEKAVKGSEQLREILMTSK